MTSFTEQVELSHLPCRLLPVRMDESSPQMSFRRGAMVPLKGPDFLSCAEGATASCMTYTWHRVMF